MTKRRPAARRRKKKTRLRTAFCALVVLILLIVGVAIALSHAYETYVKSAFHLPYYDSVMTYAERYDVPPSLIYAVMRTESKFDPDAHSPADAKGLMQVTDETYRWVQSRTDDLAGVDVSRIFEPDVNIHAGVRTLSLLREMFPVEDTAIAAYNAGLGNVQNWLADPAYSDDGRSLQTIPFAETRQYVQKVRTAQEIYQTYYQIDDRLTE